MKPKPLPSRNGHDMMRSLVNWSVIGFAVVLVLGAFPVGLRADGRVRGGAAVVAAEWKVNR